ncbi:hypothetical protein HF259_06260 [Rhizobium leguminosarum]|uniref:hypothetical protein n=1 Tax=Rhizobium leguminosarum TaxID=384 RepID=UPI001C9035ED|nr:hypothetical protein [Rhizobium leguminosarum]MBY2921042.1 hypothetical protein [Rhizobium leguminosarum]
MVAIHNTNPKNNDDLILEGLAEVIADVVTKAIDAKLPSAIESALNARTVGKPHVNQRQNGEGFKLPKSEGYKAPDGK